MKHSVFFLSLPPIGLYRWAHNKEATRGRRAGGGRAEGEGEGRGVCLFVSYSFIYLFSDLFIYLAATSGVTKVTHARRFVLFAAHLPAAPPPRLRVAALVIREPK